jgi:hypothetical protein
MQVTRFCAGGNDVEVSTYQAPEIVKDSENVRRLLKQYGVNAPRFLNRLVRPTAYACVARPQWCRPRHQHRRYPTPIADTVRAPGTFGISAWLHRSGAKRHLRCREERRGQDPRRGRRHSCASPYPRRLVAAGEGFGSRYSSGHATFPRGPARRGSGVVAPWLSKDFAGLGACHHGERPSSPPATRTS